MTFAQIGRELAISKEAAFQIYAQAMEKLRTAAQRGEFGKPVLWAKKLGKD